MNSLNAIQSARFKLDQALHAFRSGVAAHPEVHAHGRAHAAVNRKAETYDPATNCYTTYDVGGSITWQFGFDALASSYRVVVNSSDGRWELYEIDGENPRMIASLEMEQPAVNGYQFTAIVDAAIQRLQHHYQRMYLHLPAPTAVSASPRFDAWEWLPILVVGGAIAAVLVVCCGIVGFMFLM